MKPAEAGLIIVAGFSLLLGLGKRRASLYHLANGPLGEFGSRPTRAASNGFE